MSGNRRKVAVLGGGMGAMATAWRLSEPGWQDLSIDLDVAARSIANRRMDVSKMNGLTCLLPRVDEETQLVVDRVWLER